MDQKYEGKKERSPNLFKSWQKDTPKILADCVRTDSEYWKLKNFVKDPEE